MPALGPAPSSRSLARVVALGLLTVCVSSLSGCFGKTIRAHELPAYLMARPIDNAQTLDLSKLAGRTEPADRIVAGDVLEVTVAAGLSEEDVYPFKIRVQENGRGKLPHIGELLLAGLEMSQAEAAIGELAIEQGVFTAPHVTVLMLEPKMNEIVVVGAVNEPGPIALRAGSSDLLQAITAAGSLSEEAGTTVDIKLPGARDGQDGPLVAAAGGGVQQVSYEAASRSAFEDDVRRAGYQLVSLPGGGQSVEVDLASAIRLGKQGPRLPDGAVVSVEKRDPQPIFVSGLVSKPDRYEYPIGEELRLLEAISMAGDLTNQLADKVYVIRKGRSQSGQLEHVVIKTSYQKAKFDPTENIVLMPGDEVSVERTPATMFLDIFKTIGFGFTGRAF